MRNIAVEIGPATAALLTCHAWSPAGRGFVSYLITESRAWGRAGRGFVTNSGERGNAWSRAAI
jgi:hypothetical protein